MPELNWIAFGVVNGNDVLLL